MSPDAPTYDSTRAVRPERSDIADARASGHVRSWYVIHACDRAQEVIPLVDGQLAVGMRPYLMTAEADAGEKPTLAAADKPPTGSLLTAWSDVREWRKMLTIPEAVAFEIVHAHTFAAGMAGVRNCPAVVYDIRDFVESPTSGRSGQEFSWLARSFRVAEQFVIGRAGAIVVHGHAAQHGARDRGAPEECVFKIPQPLDADWLELLRHDLAYNQREAAGGAAFFAPDVCLREQDAPALPREAVLLLESFAILAGEVEDALLYVQADAGCVQPLFEKATALGIATRVHAIPPADRDRVLAQVQVIIAVASEQAEVTVLTGLLKRCAVLAADVPAARDASADGRGVLWYTSDDVRDLASRAAFLARNPDFRVALAESGRRHLLETRTPEVVARRYDAVYRYAWQRRRTRSSLANGMNLQPLVANL